MFDQILGHGNASDDVSAALLSVGVLAIALAIGGLFAEASALQEPLPDHHRTDAPYASERGHGEQDAAHVGHEA